MTDPIAVLAGTPVDTRMGVDCLTGRGLSGLSFPLSKDPREQTAFQYAAPAEKQRHVREILEDAGSRGCRRAFVYCNSLAGAVDFPSLAAETGMRIVTPLDVYRQLAPRYRSLAVIAANAQGLSGIERVLLEANPALELRGVGVLPVVESVEAGLPPEELVARHRLTELAGWFSACGAEALLLGCTHYGLIAPAISAFLGEDVKLVSASRSAARAACLRLEQNGLTGGSGETLYYTSGDAGEFSAAASRLLARDIKARQLPVMEIKS